MHVFFIPSWYPYRREPTSGIFQRDQALALAELRPDWNVTVFDWGQGELTIPLSAPERWPAVARSIVRHAPRGLRRLAPNLLEVREPVITWSPRVARGRGAAIVAAGRRALARAVEEVGPVDLVHAHVSAPGGTVARALGLPYVVTEHMGPFPFPHFLQDGALAPDIAETLRGAGVRIAVSRKLADDMERLGAGETVVVPNLVDERFFAPGPGPRATEPTFLFLGRLEAEKGLPELLKAMALLGRGFRLRVGGYGKPFETPPDAAVTWLGALDREQVLEELRGATAVVLPSRQESFGVVLAEAIACGTPIVATACGGPEDIVTEDNGLLVPVGDPSALAAALRKVTERRYDAERIRADFLARFSRSVVVDQLDSHYRRAIAARLAGHAPSGRA